VKARGFGTARLGGDLSAALTKAIDGVTGAWPTPCWPASTRCTAGPPWWRPRRWPPAPGAAAVSRPPAGGH